MFDFNVSRINSTRLSKSINKSKKELTNKTNLNAMYMGIVENTNDPFGLGRIKVRIPALHGTNSSQSYFLPTKQLPWAFPGNLSGGSNDMGQYIVPPKGSKVMVTFELDSFNKPIYMGTVGSTTYTGNKKTCNDNDDIYSGKSVDIKSNDRISDLKKSTKVSAGKGSNKSMGAKEKMTSGKTVLYKTLKGATVLLDDTDGSEALSIIDATGQTLVLGNDSGTALNRRGNKTKPSKDSSPYMALKNNLGDAVEIEKGQVIVKTGSGEKALFYKGNILLTTSNGEEISIADGEINIETSNGEKLNLADGKINLEMKDNSISMESGKITMSNSESNMTMEGSKLNMSNGTSSINLDGSNVSMSNGSGTMTMSGNNLNLSGGSIFINGAQVWTNNYHPGV